MRTAEVRLLLAVALSTVGCADNDQEPEQADELLARVQAEDYRQWTRAPGYETRQPSHTSHSRAVDIYVNATVASALEGEALDRWPVGSIIVKDGFDGETLKLTAVMEKRDDGWFWAEYKNNDSKFSGKPDVCLDCHDIGDDYVRAFSLPR